MQNNNAYKCFILHNFADVYFNTFFLLSQNIWNSFDVQKLAI